MRIELIFSAWKAEVITVTLYPHKSSQIGRGIAHLHLSLACEYFSIKLLFALLIELLFTFYIFW